MNSLSALVDSLESVAGYEATSVLRTGRGIQAELFTKRGKRMRKPLLLLALLATSPLAAQKYEVTHTFTVGGEGGWDYVLPDAPRHRLFVARGNRFMVVDMNDGHLITEIRGFNGAHGTALVPDIGRGFA